MVNTAPAPIKEYYIAYFDLLGYKEYLKNNPDKVGEFLNIIHYGIQSTTNYIDSTNKNPIASLFANMNIKVKIFSDNVLMCMEVGSNKNEKTRLLAFMSAVAEIQRGFVLQCGLFLRGGIVRGDLSFNDDFVFGQGVVDAVKLEERAVYPRIILAENIKEFLSVNHFYTEAEASKAIEIEESSKNGKEVSIEEVQFYQRMLSDARAEKINQQWMAHIVLPWADGECCLQYLYNFKIEEFCDRNTIEGIFQTINKAIPINFEAILNNKIDFDAVLKRHKKEVEKQLKLFGQYTDIKTGDSKSAELRERVLLKYVWVMAYHNHVCRVYEKPECMISTQCNCDSRFLRTTIEVIE